MAEPFEKQTYFALTLDPVHIGTGGYRLGRVDNTITRDPGTNIPKIPGSSIAGVTRAYTAMAIQCEEPVKERYLRKVENSGNREDGTEPEPLYGSCAGKGGDGGDGHCGEHNCEVCVAYGFSKKESSFQGLVQFYDARILLFPIYSMIGPIWITCPSILSQFNIHCMVAKSSFKHMDTSEKLSKLNFGWVMLKHDEGEKVSWDQDKFPTTNEFKQVFNIIADKTFVVPDSLFSHLVNDNLEVRSSVAINPKTGAAEDTALFTYEAIPRATLMWFDVVYNRPEFFRVNKKEILNAKGRPADVGWLMLNVEKGLRFLKDLGVGGMNTRGMGRIEVLNLMEGLK